MTNLSDILNNLLGSYSPIVTTLSNGDEVVSLNWEYIVTAAIFGLCLWSTFRLIGSFFKNV